MSEGAGDQAPEEHADNVPPEEAQGVSKHNVEGMDTDHDEDLKHTSVKIDESIRRVSRKQSMYPAAQASSAHVLDIDRTALEAILDVSSRLKDIQKKSKVSMSTLNLAHESYKDKQVNKAIN